MGKTLYFSSLAYAEKHLKEFDNIFIVDYFKNTTRFWHRKYRFITPLYPPIKILRKYLSHLIDEDRYKIEYIKYLCSDRDAYDELNCIVSSTEFNKEKNLIVVKKDRTNSILSTSLLLTHAIRVLFPSANIEIKDFGCITK